MTKSSWTTAAVCLFALLTTAPSVVAAETDEEVAALRAQIAALTERLDRLEARPEVHHYGETAPAPAPAPAPARPKHRKSCHGHTCECFIHWTDIPQLQEVE